MSTAHTNPPCGRLARRCLLAALAVAMLGAPAASAVTLPAGFDIEPEVAGLTRPTKIAWAPDGRRFVAEKDGMVHVAAPGHTDTEVLINLLPEVNSFSDRGLLGLAIDSNFAIHPYLYLLYTYDLRRATDPDSEEPMVSKLRRLKISPDNQVLESKVLLGTWDSGPCPTPSNDVDCLPSDGTSHSIGTVLSAPDGTLFVGNGDGAGYNTTDPLSLRSYDDRSMSGKVLHIDREGRGVSGHPRCQAETDLRRVCTKVYARGFRNPFRFTRRQDGSLLVGDVGWNSYEEIDLIRPADAGRSYGWPCYEASIRTPSWRDWTQCQNEYKKEGTAEAHLGSIHSWAHNGMSAAALAGPEYTGDSYPAGYGGSAFIADYGLRFVKRLRFGAGGLISEEVPFAGDWQGFDLSAAPNGDLTWADPGGWGEGEGMIARVVYSPGNDAPEAVAEASPLSGPAPLEVDFDGSGSSDPEGAELTYSWDFGDGAHGAGSSPSHVYTSPGSFTATLTVSDGTKSATDSMRIDVSNTPPVPVITEPADGSLYRAGEQLIARGAADDAEEGSLPAAGLRWKVFLIHRDHTHLYGSFAGVDEVPITPLTDHDADSYYRIELTARDGAGATGSTAIELYPQTIRLSLLSEPAGAPLSYAGVAVTAPHRRDAAVGAHSSVTAAASFARDGSTYVFDGWSDGGGRAHTLVVPAAETTLIARYKLSSGPLIGPIPGPVIPVGKARDTRGPLLWFERRRGLRLRRHRLSGSVSDGAGVLRVQAALALVRRGRCAWVAGKPRAIRRRARSCSRPRWLATHLAKGGRRFTLRLPRRLPAGTYKLRLRAWDKLGNRATRLGDGRRWARLRLP